MSMLPFLGQYYYVIAIFQLICIIHAMKTNRRDWIYVIAFLPGIGIIAYFIREMLPEIQTGVFIENVQRILFPMGKVKELERQVRISDTETNRLNLAHEYARTQQYSKAAELTKSCLRGIYAQDPGFMLEVARFTFLNGQYDESVAYFNRVLATKKLDKPEDELLYARAMEGNGNAAQAEEEYKKIIRIHHSIEAKYHYGVMLKKQNRNADAKAQFQSIRDEKDLHPKYVRRMNARWISGARREMSVL